MILETEMTEHVPLYTRGVWATAPNPIVLPDDEPYDTYALMTQRGYRQRFTFGDGMSIDFSVQGWRHNDGGPYVLWIDDFDGQPILASDYVDALDLAARWAPLMIAVSVKQLVDELLNDNDFGADNNVVQLGARLATGAEMAGTLEANERAAIARRRAARQAEREAKA